MSIYFYGRVSTLRQVDGESLDVQYDKCKGYSESVLNEKLSGKFVERGVSGTKRFCDRKQGKKLLWVVKEGDTIISSKLDRLWRSSLDCLNTIDLLKSQGVKVVVLDLNGEITSQNGVSRLFMTMLSCFGEMERDRIRERIIEVKDHQKKQGKYLGGKRKFGYKIIKGGYQVEDDKEQKIIDRIIELRNESSTLQTIQDTIKEETGVVLNLVHIHRLSQRELKEVV